jgi:hypothetical protein
VSEDEFYERVLRGGLSLGLSVKDTYASTLYELEQIRQIRKKTTQAEFNSQLSLEHLNAQLNSWAFSTHPERMPSVESLIRKKVEPVKKPAQMKLEAAKLGIRVP